jgi:glycogen(starch) synthase
VELFGLQLIHRLQKTGVEVEVVCDHGASSLPAFMEHEGIRIHRFPMRAALAGKDLGRLRDLVEAIRAVFRQFSPDLVHLNTLQLGAFLFSRITERRQCPMLLTVHDSPSESYNQGTLARELAHQASAVAAVSSAMLYDFQKAYPGCSARLELIHNGLEPFMDPPQPPPPEPLRLFSAGRLVRDKGFDLVLEALSLLKDPPITWTLAGAGAEEASLRAQCTRLNLERQVVFTGHLPWEDIYHQMDASHLVLMPSRWQEPFGLVALQAAQRARPVIAARVGGLPEVVAEGKTGWLFTPDNAHELAEQIRAASASPALRMHYGNAAQKRAETLFSMETMATRYLELYRELCT